MLALSEPGIVERVKKVGVVAGFKEGQAWNPVAGWVEYDIQIPQNGWYDLDVPANVWLMEYFMDGELVLGVSSGGKISNFWLTAGKHVLRIQRWHWSGFQPAFEKWTLWAAGTELGKNLRLLVRDGRTIIRAGEDVKLTIQGGGRSAAATITVRLIDTASKSIVAKKEVSIPAGEKLVEFPVELNCPNEGVFELSLADGEKQLTDVRPLQIVAVDTRSPARGGALKKTLLSEIDCVTTEPQFSGDGGSKIVDGTPGKYRESGSIGYLYSQHHGQDCSWFAYKFTVPEAGKPYIFEADCPDDAFRTFAIAIRDANPDAYPVAGGMDTGGCFALTKKMQTQSLLFWPRSTDLRAWFVPAHCGRPGAAVSKIRIYRVENDLPILDVPILGGRTFANWYEEGDNFLAMYGGDRSIPGMLLDSDRWARSVAHMGGDTLIDTVSVYQMSMYPSNHNTPHCSSSTFDLVRVLTMKCEKYGMGFIAEFHSECRDLDHLGDPAFSKKPRTNYMTNKDGFTKQKNDSFPKFHPLDPLNQEWYIGLVGEFADRYKDSPALRGVSLRLMGWQNPALNNFHNLDWGYDDLTVGMFEKETGLSTGTKPDDPKRFHARYEWLMANAKDKWIAWRCQKIAELYTRLRDRLRQSRPDLKLYTDVFDRPDMGLEAGVDPRLLGAIDGVVVINSRSPYGRQAYTYEGPLADSRRRDSLLDPAQLLAMRKPNGESAFMFYSCYFEGTDVVVPPERLGYPKETRKTWISAVINPSGRQYLERYAIALAQTDVTFFSDGGNAYTLGQPILQEFMNEFRRLPPVLFKSRADACDPVCVRDLSRNDDFLFYAINSERYPVRVTLTIKTPGPVKRLATDEELKLTDGKLSFELDAYQLRTFKAPAGTEIAAVTTTIPDDARVYVESLVKSARALNEDAASGKFALDEDGRKLLAKTVDDAELCLKEGRYWRARTIFENSQLNEKLYAKALSYPPGLEFLADPDVLKVMKMKNVARPSDAILTLALEQIDNNKTSAGGKQGSAVQAVCEGNCDIREGRNGKKALHLDGKSGRIVVKGLASDSKKRTISLWVNAENVGGRRGIVGGFAGDAFFWNGSLAAEGGDKSGRSTSRTGDNTFEAGKWYHLAITIDSGKAIALYVNGTETKVSPFPQTLEGGTELVLGWNGWGGVQNDASPGWFAGRISDVRVFDRVLSADELLSEWAGKE